MPQVNLRSSAGIDGHMVLQTCTTSFYDSGDEVRFKFPTFAIQQRCVPLRPFKSKWNFFYGPNKTWALETNWNGMKSKMKTSHQMSPLSSWNVVVKFTHLRVETALFQENYRRWTNYSNPCNPITPRAPDYNVFFLVWFAPSNGRNKSNPRIRNKDTKP